jgi:hypothetical protein
MRPPEEELLSDQDLTVDLTRFGGSSENLMNRVQALAG